VSEYKVASGHDAASLASTVNQALAEGFEPLGGVAVAASPKAGQSPPYMYAQALVKPTRAAKKVARLTWGDSKRLR
jgi:hypothetical protein